MSSDAQKTFVGFGCGAIQTGLFLLEAQAAGRFRAFTVAEVAPDLVAAVRAAGGRLRVNVATARGIEHHALDQVEILNPAVPAERAALVAAVARADELATALPSVAVYEAGGAASVASVLADGIALRGRRGPARRSVVYTAENHNHAAEQLEEHIARRLGGATAWRRDWAFLNTVIGKMSGIVADEAQIAEQGLARLAGASGRCVLVEAFNRILVSRIPWPDVERGFPMFVERADLLPFEEAKLYGHNATHALIGYLARRAGLTRMAEVRQRPALLDTARAAFLEESGAALCRKYAGVDALFTPGGYRAYADDLLERMLNPYLRDAVERVVRDPRRKLGWDDRLVGTMRLALEAGIRPVRYAAGARAALAMLQERDPRPAAALLDEIWADSRAVPGMQAEIASLILAAPDA